MRKYLSAALIPAFALSLMAGTAATAQDRDARREARQERREARQGEPMEDRTLRAGEGGRQDRRSRDVGQDARRERLPVVVPENRRERLEDRQETRQDRREDRGERRDERRDDRAERRDDRFDRRDDRRDDRVGRRDDRREYRQDRRQDQRFDRAWRQSRYRFRAQPYYAPRGYGARAWRSGEFLPWSYRTRTYVIYQPNQFYLPPPPYGFYWARVGAEAVLVRQYDGLIVEVVAGLFYW